MIRKQGETASWKTEEKRTVKSFEEKKMQKGNDGEALGGISIYPWKSDKFSFLFTLLLSFHTFHIMFLSWSPSKNGWLLALSEQKIERSKLDICVRRNLNSAYVQNTNKLVATVVFRNNHQIIIIVFSPKLSFTFNFFL